MLYTQFFLYNSKVIWYENIPLSTVPLLFLTLL